VKARRIERGAAVVAGAGVLGGGVVGGAEVANVDREGGSVTVGEVAP
jgi:hypothetical protein